MNILYVLVGLPASGKSTWAKQLNNVEIFSSDFYREKLFENINDQTHNDEVFKTLYKDIKTNLLSHKDCVFDATNINRKDRRQILNYISNIKCKKVAVVFATPIELCIIRNNNRDRVVPSKVLYRMESKFEIPIIGEGFDEILFIYPENYKKKSVDELFEIMKNFNQNNPHHTLTLDKHCELAKNKILDASQKAKFLDDRVHILITTAKLHDLGKIYSKSIDENNISHYYHHENIGAYKVLTELNDINVEKIATLINYHMLLYSYDNMSESKKYNIELEFDDLWQDLILLHEVDLLAH